MVKWIWKLNADLVNMKKKGTQALVSLCRCKTRLVSADVNVPEKASVRLGGVGMQAAFKNHISAVSGGVTVTSLWLWLQWLRVVRQHHCNWWNAVSSSSSSSCCPFCQPVSVLDKLLSVLHVHIMQLTVCVRAVSDVKRSTISHPKCSTFFSNWPFLVWCQWLVWYQSVKTVNSEICKRRKTESAAGSLLYWSWKVFLFLYIYVFECIVTWPPSSQQHSLCSLCRVAYWCQSEESAVVSSASKEKRNPVMRKWQSAQWGGIRLPLKWEPNKPARLSLSVFAPLSSSPSSPLSAVTPPLSPSVASPPPRRLSLKRFSLFSRFPGKHLHGPKEGGREGFLLKTTSPFSFFFFYNCHLQSPDPASQGPIRV